MKNSLRRAHEKETNPLAKTQLRAIMENIRLSEQYQVPICQDTGLISFYLEAGSDFPDLDKISPSIRRGVRRASEEVPLRPNSVDPFNHTNTGDNTGRNIPYLNWQIVKGDTLKITALPKGGGSENTCALSMLKPSEGLEGLKIFVLESVVKAGGMPCPPTIIGVGVGGGSNIAMDLAKESLLRSIDEVNPNPKIADLEKELLEAVNATGIGPMGLGGDCTALAVKLDYANRHPASFPVAVAFQCWAARRATARIHSDGKIEYLTHKNRMSV